jgi:hypothetical protein
MKRITGVAAIVAALALCASPVWAQVQAQEDVITPTPAPQGSGAITPYFYISLQTLFSAGYNFETKAGGFRNYAGDANDGTWVSFSVSFVDSHYQSPKLFEVGTDPDAWTGKFKFMNFTYRLDSWQESGSNAELNQAQWLAEISGKGAHIGFFTQAGALLGSMRDTQSGNSRTEDVKPWTKISAGNKVLNLGDNDLGKSYYNTTMGESQYETVYGAGSGGAMMYAGYEKPELFNVYITALSEGNVNSDVSEQPVAGSDEKRPKNDGLAAALDFGVSPFGLITDDEHPLTVTITGNAVGGMNYERKWGDLGTAEGDAGFGLKADGGYWLGDHLVIAPVFAFDGQMYKNSDKEDAFAWKTGAGLTFQFSPMRWVNDDWGELSNMGNYYSVRYENNQILKYAYAQAYLAYSDTTNLDMLLKVEEPDGDPGFHDKIGALYELRLYNINLSKDDRPVNSKEWEMWGRFSYDLSVKGHPIIPYIRFGLDNRMVTRLRLGAQANLIPYTGFELAYTTANLNPNADITSIAADTGLGHYKNIADAGRLELLVMLKSDNVRPRPRKRMDDWSYNTYAATK